MINILFIGLYILIFGQKALSERSMQKCTVDRNLKCILNNSKYLSINEYCMDKDGIIYKGVDGIGLCIMVGYSEQEENDIDIREVGSNNGSENAGYYIKSENGENLSTIGTGKLNYCSNNQGTSGFKCNEVDETSVQSGYYRNGDNNEIIPYIKCTKGSNICEAIKIEISECTTAGNIFKEQNIYKLCLDNNVSVSLSDTDKKYFISINTANAFGQNNGSFVLIKISNENALKDDNENKKYQYANKNSEITTKDEICGDQEKIKEFKLVDEENKYYQIISKT